MMTKITSFWNDFVDILFPRLCHACSHPLVGKEAHLCSSCLLDLPRVPQSGMVASMVEMKFAGFHAVKEVRAFLIYHPKGKVQALLRSLKYEDSSQLGVFLGRLCASEWTSAERIPVAELLVPVPLHARKQKERGYNQSECFCRGFSELSGIPVDATLLQRDVYTLSQTKKTKAERIAAMQGVFSLRTGVDLRNLRIILVDDVLTTGATLEGCVDVLTRHGCKEISILTIAAAQS